MSLAISSLAAGIQALLAVDHRIVVILFGRRHQHGADELFPRRACIDLLADVLQQLMHLFVRSDLLALVIRDDVEALPECPSDTVFVVFDAGHLLRSSNSATQSDELVTRAFRPEVEARAVRHHVGQGPRQGEREQHGQRLQAVH